MISFVLILHLLYKHNSVIFAYLSVYLLVFKLLEIKDPTIFISAFMVPGLVVAQ